GPAPPGAPSPRVFGNPGLAVGVAGEDEQEVRKPVEVGEHQRIDLLLPGQAHEPPLRAPADRAREVEQCARRRPSRQDERLQRRQLLLSSVDRIFEALHVLAVTAAFGLRPPMRACGSASWAPRARRALWTWARS